METLSRRHKKPNPRSRASFLSRITFWYLNPLFQKGSKTRIEVTDIHATLREYSSSKLGKETERGWEAELTGQSQGHKASLLSALIRPHKALIIKMGIITLLMECFHLISPYMVGFVVDYFVPTNKMPKRDALLYAGACTLSIAFATILHHWMFFSMECLGLKQRTALTSLVYQKVIRLSQVTFSKTSAGQIVNFVSSDAQKMLLALVFLHHLWIAPLHIIATTVLLYNLIGVAAFPGAGIMLLVAFYQIGLGKLFARLRNKIATMTDKRVRIMGEIIKGMRAIKMYSWEGPFADLVKDVRRSVSGRVS